MTALFSYLCDMRLRLTEHAPMLPVTLSLAAGIAAASWRMPPLWVSAAGVAVCTTVAAATLRSARRTATAAIILAAMFLGATLTAIKLRTSPMTEEYAVYEIAVDDDSPDRRTARLISCRDDRGAWHRVRGRLRIYSDSTLQLSAGQRIVCRGRVRGFGGSDGYGAMMRRKGFAGRLFISENNILQISEVRPSALLGSMHRRAVAKIGSLPLKPADMAVAQALGTGETSLLERGRRAEYSRAGMAHLLALSGLHVGIVYLLINLLLSWLPLLTHGHIIRNAAAVILLWAYIFSTGMPPSAIRAALMFTMLQTARAASADYSPLNALACAAFISLCADAGLLFDAGFRLSYIAVAAIILCAAPICRRLHIIRESRSKAAKVSISAANFVIDTLVVGFVATVATAPLVSHLFGVIPLAGIVTGPVAIVAAAATVMLTAVWIALPLNFAAAAFGRAIDLAAGALNGLSEWLAALPQAAIDIRLSSTETALCYAVMTAAAIVLASISDNRQPQNTPFR